MVRLLPWCLALALVVVGCSSGSSGGGGGGGGCEPGVERACRCLGGGDGLQTCGADGAFAVCDCGSDAVPVLEVYGEGVPDPSGGADAAFDFGARMVGDRVSAVLQLRNAGTGALEVQPDAVAAPFELETPAALTLAPGESAEVRYAFRPLTAGASTVVATLTSNGGSARVRLAGEGFEPELACEPAALAFGEVSLAETRRELVRCVNVSAHPWALQAGPLGGADAAHFALAPLALEEVPPGESWDLRIEAAPARVGALSATVPLAAANGRAAGSIALSATGVPAGLWLSTEVLDFGVVAPGGARTARLGLTNPTLSDLQVIGLRLDPSSAPRFTWQPTELPIVVPARTAEGLDGIAELEVTFRPIAADVGYRKNGVLVIETNDPAHPTFTVPLTGFAGGPVITCSPASLDFGVVAAGLPGTRSFACTNGGSGDPERPDDNLIVDGLVTTNPEFVAVPRTPLAPGGYAVGETFTVDVTYDPVDDGPDQAEVRILSNDVVSTPERPYAVAVSATGRVLPPCEFTIVPPELRFGVVEPGASVTLEFAVRNGRADAECVVGQLRLDPACGPAFSLPRGQVSLDVIPPSGELRFPVAFAPQAASASPLACDLQFEITNPTTPHQVVPLHGTAGTSCVRMVPDALDFGKVKPGCGTKDREIQLVNVCAAPLVIADVAPLAGASAEFVVRSAPPAGTTVGPGLAATFTVAYGPDDQGDDLGAVAVTLQGSTEPYLLPLRGRGDLSPTRLDLFEQADAPKVDVLLVIDNGGTMAQEQAALAANLRPFVSFAQAFQIDYQLGVTTTGLTAGGTGCPGGASGGENGRLFPVDNSRPRILTPATPNLEAAWSANATVGTCQTAGQPLEAAFRALQPPLVDGCDDPRTTQPNDGNCGFLREEALSILAVTDRADTSGTAAFYLHAFQALKGFDNTHLFAFHALTGNRLTGCTGTAGTAAAGDTLIDVAEQSGGMFRSICSTNWANTLRELSAGVFGAETCFFLSATPEDTNGNGHVRDWEGELEVRLDGVVTGSTGAQGQTFWTYDPVRDAVCFNPMATPPPGTQIEVAYRPACVSW